MFMRTLTVSVLALGLLAPAAMAGNGSLANYSNGCSMDQTRDGDFIDCKTDANGTSSQPFAASGVVPYDGMLGHDLEGSTQSKAGVSTTAAP